MHGTFDKNLKNFSQFPEIIYFLISIQSSISLNSSSNYISADSIKIVTDYFIHYPSSKNSQ